MATQSVSARADTETAVDQAAEVASTAADAAGQLAETAGDQARQVGGALKQQAEGLTNEVAEQGRHLVDDTKTQLHDQARQQTDKLAESLRRVAEQLSGVLEGKPPEEGALHDYVGQAASKMSELAQRVDQRGYDGLIDDAQRFARRRPGVFLAGAAAAGFAIGRLLRGSKDKEKAESDQLALPQTASPASMPARP